MSIDKFSFDLEFQKKIIALLIRDGNFLIKGIDYIQPEYFDGNVLPWIFKQIKSYYDKYTKNITANVFIQEINKLPKEENKLEYVSVVKEILKISVPEKEYILDKVKEFIQRNIYVKGYKKAQEVFNDGNFDNSLDTMTKYIEEVRKVSFEAPNRSWFFEEASDRIARRYILEDKDVRIHTGVPDLDVVCDGGLTRGELAVVGGDSGVGKSIFLIGAGVAALKSFKNVVHFSLEGKSGQVADRFESRFLDQDYRNVVKNTFDRGSLRVYKRHYGTLIIVELNRRWDYTVLDIERELEELRSYRFIPDVITVDYGDLLAPRLAKRDNLYQSSGEVFQDLKTLATRNNALVWTATQFNRMTKDEKEDDINFIWTRKKIADSYHKLRVADLFVTLNITPQERAARTMRVYVDKYRDNECGKVIKIKTDFRNMHFCRPTKKTWEDFQKKLC